MALFDHKRPYFQKRVKYRQPSWGLAGWCLFSEHFKSLKWTTAYYSSTTVIIDLSIVHTTYHVRSSHFPNYLTNNRTHNTCRWYWQVLKIRRTSLYFGSCQPVEKWNGVDAKSGKWNEIFLFCTSLLFVSLRKREGTQTNVVAPRAHFPYLKVNSPWHDHKPDSAISGQLFHCVIFWESLL